MQEQSFLGLLGVMIFNIFHGFSHTGLHVHIMHGLGWLMIFLYLFVWFRPYKALQQAVSQAEFPAGAVQLAVIRKVILVNLILGLTTIIVGSAGRYI